MKTNKLDKIFGPTGSFAGVIILLFGIYACFYSWIGITTIVVGAFLALSNTSTTIDFKNKKIKFSNNLFGVFSIGYWTDIKSGMSLAIHKSLKSYTSFSQSNRKTTQTIKDYRIILLNDSGNTIMAVQKFNKKEDAINEMNELNQKLFNTVIK
jgi:hypothetical protein